MRPLFFIHIPKTAGTSLRVALEKSLGAAAICADYGDGNPQTSQVVQDCMFNGIADPYQLALQQPRSRVLTGHIPVAKYAPLFAVQDIFTLVREPTARVISEYFHFQRHFDFQGSLSDFAKQKRKQNSLSRYLRRVPWQALGYVGISERYSHALDSLNQLYQLNLVAEVLNAKPAAQNVTITAQEIALLHELNRSDLRLYEKITQALDWRYHCQQADQPYTHGAATIAKKKQVLQGFAFYSATHPRCNEPVVLTLLGINSSQEVAITQHVTANLHHQKMTALHAPRCGYVGFRLDIAELLNNSQLTTLELRVRQSQQLLWQFQSGEQER
ncbi:MAG: sulfotransferase family protein [Gammaproteobacteria bacterium]|nr:sulfotransferase family protein [Gammaproteobacteria bacterium]